MKKSLFVFLTIATFSFISCENLIKDKAVSPFRFIPENSSFILETNDFLSLWNTYSKSNIWDLKKENPGLQKVYDNLQTLKNLSRESADIKSSLSEKKILFSLVNIKRKSPLLMVVQSSHTIKELKNLVRKNFNEQATLTSIKIKDITAYKIIFSDQKDILYVSAYKGNILAAYQKPAISKAIEQYRLKRNLKDNNAFNKIYQTSGEYTDASLYVNFANLSKTLKVKGNQTDEKLIEGLSEFAKWGALDITAKKDRLLMNGFVSADTSNYLSVFKEKANFDNLKKILPNESAIVFSQHFNNSNNLSEGLNEQISTYQNVNQSYNLKSSFFPYVDNNVVLAITSANSGRVKENTYAYLKTKDPQQAFNALEKVATKMDKNHYNKQYQGYQIIRVPSDNFFREVLGNSFIHFQSPYFTVFNEYLIGCPSRSSLVNLIQELEDGKSLAQNDIYQSAASGITSESNLSLYLDITEALKMIPGNHPFNKTVEKNRSFFNSLNGLSIEFTAANRFYFTSVFLNTGEKLRTKGENNWDLQLESKIVGKPHIVNDHLSADKRIIVFDALNNMYFINHKGEIIWKHMLSGRPLSGVYEVDAYKNNKVQYLLNTENYIYLIDVLGRDVGNFPVELATQATNGLSLFDYTGNKYYRIMIAGSDKKVYNYDIEGKQVEGWQKPLMEGEITRPVQRLVYGNRDYIIIADKKGNVKITNRRGVERINVNRDFTNGTNTAFYINRTNNKAPFITTNQQGALTYLNGNGSIRKTSFDNFSSGHHFFYEKFNEDPNYDFIYFDKNKLTVFDRFKEIVSEHNFGDQVLTEPEMVTFKDDKALIFTSLSDERLYLVTKDGVNEKINRLEGSTLFDIGKLKRFGKNSVVVGKEEKLFKYLID